MALKTFTINFTEFAKDSLLRTNIKTIFFGLKIQEKINNSSKRFIKLKDIFSILSGYAFKSEDYTDEGIPLIRISDVENGFNEKEMVFLPDEYKEKYKNYLLKQNDITVSLTGDGKIKSDLIQEDNKFLLNQRVGALRPKKQENIKFYYYLINNSSLVKDQFYWWSNGKTQLNISPFDLLKIKIPLIPKTIQDQIVSKIEPIEKQIKELKSQIKDPQEIINQVFAREFGFDLEKFEESKKEKFFEVDFSKLSNYHTLRFDVKHQKYFDIFNEIISKFNSSFSLKKISKDGGKYGANEPAKDGEKGFDIRYIRITDIDNIGNLTDEDWKTAENIDEQYLLQDNDFLFARSGNTVGKTFLYDSKKHEKAIFAGYFIKFNLDFTNLDKIFFLYYTKSFIYDFWVKGIVRIKGQPNINANEYLELKIPNIPLPDQQKIVNEIKKELDKQEEIKKQIEEKRNEIDEIIQQVVS